MAILGTALVQFRELDGVIWVGCTAVQGPRYHAVFSGSGQVRSYETTRRLLQGRLLDNERRLMGEEVSIAEFSDERCVLRFRNHLWYKLYDTATHLRRQISPEDYRGLFESIWQDRAKESGWHASFEYAGHDTKVALVPLHDD